jgi:hypothetical protein
MDDEHSRSKIRKTRGKGRPRKIEGTDIGTSPIGSLGGSEKTPTPQATPRKAISKHLRFIVFARDKFTCRYCGRQSDTVALEIDHIIPVCQGGTNDPENLITACSDCNLGKGGRTPTAAAPTEEDRLRLAQERNEQCAALATAIEAQKARARLEQEICNYWCSRSGRGEMSTMTLRVLCSYSSRFGPRNLLSWFDTAWSKIGWRNPPDEDVGKYISGIKRTALERGEIQDAESLHP